MLSGLRTTIAHWIGGKHASEAQPRSGTAEATAWQERFLKLKAQYDAARTTDEFRNYWAHADQYDADSANAPNVRHMLIRRSRYEINNNGYSDGIAQTYATDLVGVGPQLQMQTGSVAFNQMVERSWSLWCKAIGFRRKFWCMAHAKHSDGEAFGIIRRNPGVKHAIKLDVVLHEAEQIQSWVTNFGQPGEIDGLAFDKYGNPERYYLLPQHPGAAGVPFTISLEPEEIPAELMLHWFKMRRPGQHRAVPECTSTLQTGAAGRRWREATLAAAETAADLAALIETQQLGPQEAPDEIAPLSEFEMQKRMMLALPMGWKATQMTAEHPNATYETFHKTLVNEQSRPKSMPYNKAACDSSSYNYASGRLDHQTYYASIDVEREDGNDLVLDKLFDVWLNVAILTFGWLGGNPDAVGAGARLHCWDWPKHRVADVESEANANNTKLRNGSLTLSDYYSDQGEDFEDVIVTMAADFGVTVEQLRQRLFDNLLPPPKVLQPFEFASSNDNGASPRAPSPAPPPAAARGPLNRLNGVNHG